MKKKLSINDVAKALNVSKTAVSFIINGKARERKISKCLELTVLDYVKKVNYIPNATARSLVTGETKTLGILVEDISDPFFAGIARVIEREVNSRGYKIIISSTDNDPERICELIQTYRSRQIDGYIIAPPPGIKVKREIKSLIDSNIPVVLFDRCFNDIKTDNVIVNNFDSAYQAVNHLYANGYKSIGLVTLALGQVQMQDRLQGYLRAVKEQGSSPSIKEIAFHDDKGKIVENIEDFLKSNKNLDAIFFATNYLAEAGLRAIKNLDVSIPEKLGVVVFDDYNLNTLYTPSITAISQPINDISNNIVDLLFNRLSSLASKTGNKTIVLQTSLVIRESSKCGSLVDLTL